MNWSEIEAKWAAMARRVQSDQVQDNEDTVTPCGSEPPSQSEDAPELRAPSSLFDDRAA